MGFLQKGLVKIPFFIIMNVSNLFRRGIGTLHDSKRISGQEQHCFADDRGRMTASMVSGISPQIHITLC